MKSIFNISLFLFSFFFFSCGERLFAPPIGKNMSFPGALVAFDQTHFLLLNTAASGDYSTGSIHKYSVDSIGTYTLENVLEVPAYGAEIAVSPDRKLVALSFAATASSTRVFLYEYGSSSTPRQLSHLTLTFPSAGGKQTIKRMGFFKRASDPNYYFYGTILTYGNDDGTRANIPPRSFVVRIAADLSSSNILFILSYGLNDQKSLTQNSPSLINPSGSSNFEYMFGFAAPTYDAKHDLFLAFPTGVVGESANNNIAYIGFPDPLGYFGKSSVDANKLPCTKSSRCLQPDFRTVSLAAVDMGAFNSSVPLNNATYFVPMGWNQNGIPYAARSNNIDIIYPSQSNVVDKDSFTFQVGFSTSYWASTSYPGNNGNSCFPSFSSSAENQYTVLGENSLFVVKSGLNGAKDVSAGNNTSGNEVFVVSGLDILRANINLIQSARGTRPDGESDFKVISSYNLIDRWNTVPRIKDSWLVGTATDVSQNVDGDPKNKNSGPLTPYMFSRTSGVSYFASLSTVIGNMGILNFGSQKCLPYWVRQTANLSFLGRDSSWLSANPLKLQKNNAALYPNFSNSPNAIDPSKPSIFPFVSGSGAETCADIYFTRDQPKIFCVNFLTSEVTKYNVRITNNENDPVFTSF
jgi:hypothetical protein